MDQKLIQKFVQEIGSLRVELLHRDTVIESLQEKIAELEAQQESKKEE